MSVVTLIEEWPRRFETTSTGMPAANISEADPWRLCGIPHNRH